MVKRKCWCRTRNWALWVGVCVGVGGGVGLMKVKQPTQTNRLNYLFIQLSAPGPEIQIFQSWGNSPYCFPQREFVYDPACRFPSPSSSLGVFCCDFCSVCVFSRLRGRSAPAVTSGCRWPSEDPEDSRSPALLISILQSCRP